MIEKKGRVLLAAYDFPPRVRSGSYRPMRFARSLAAAGWRVVVLTASELEDTRESDNTLCGGWDSMVEIRKVFSVSSLIPPVQEAFSRVGIGGLVYRLRKTLLFPDEKILWALSVLFRLMRMGTGPDDVLLTTSPPWSVHLAGLVLRRIRGVKWVADHRDPWTDNPHFRGKGPLTVKLHRYVEGLCHRYADAVITASRMQKDRLVRSFGINRDRVLALYSGYDGTDFAAARRTNRRDPKVEGIGDDTFFILYTGAFYQDYFPRVFLDGLAAAADGNEKVRNRMRVVFMLSDGGDRMKKEIRRLGLDDLVRVRPAVPHADLPDHLRAADCLFLYVPEIRNSDAWVPGKTFEYLGSGTPVLAVVPPDGEAALLVRRSGRGMIASPSDPASVQEVLTELAEHGFSRQEEPDSGERELEAGDLEWSILSKELTRLVNAILTDRREYRSGRKLSVALAASGLGIVDRGVERFTEELGKSLGAHFEVSVYGGGGVGNGHRNIACLSRNNRVAKTFEDLLPAGLHRLVRRLHLDILELERLTFSLGVLGALANRKHDVLIQSDGFWGAHLSNLAGIILGTKVISVGHGGLGGAVEELASASDHYVTVNPAIVEDLRRSFPGRNISFLPTTVDTERFRPAGTDVDPGLERPVYLTVGSLDPEKRIDLAVRAVAGLEAGSLLVIGCGPLERELRELGTGLLGPERFRLVHVPWDQMVHYYNAADVFTMPSVREAFPLAVLEALACDLPVVTVREGARALFGDECIVYCDPSHAEEYAQALMKALSRRHSGVSRNRVMEYNTDSVGGRWAGLIREVADR